MSAESVMDGADGVIVVPLRLGTALCSSSNG